MKINCHVDPNISEEHGELWIKKMTPAINELLQKLTKFENSYGAIINLKFIRLILRRFIHLKLLIEILMFIQKSSNLHIMIVYQI